MVIGGKEKGFQDGSLQDALFNSPQGVASYGSLLFVADTENHALRQVRFVVCKSLRSCYLCVDRPLACVCMPSFLVTSADDKGIECVSVCLCECVCNV